jgi:osmotically-inducible protein OsmY
MRLLNLLLLAGILLASLSACAPVVVGGAAAGGAMAADRRTSGAYVEDESIEWKTLLQINETLGARIHANITSFNRSVLLTGEAIDEPTRQKAEEIAKNIQNVRNVTNELQVAGASSLTSRSNDAYLTSKVKAQLFRENRFPANYVKVVTENSVVYLMGMVTRKEAEDAVEIARSTDGVQKVVKVFEYVVEQ